MTMKRLQEIDNFVSNRQDNDLWVKKPSIDTETSQRQNCNEYELAEDKYLKYLGTTDNTEQTYIQDSLGNKENGHMSHLYREIQKDKMQNMRRKIEFLERCMQRGSIRLDRIQQDPLLTPSISMVGIRLKQLIEQEYHDYLENDQNREQTTHEHARYVNQYDLTKNK